MCDTVTQTPYNILLIINVKTKPKIIEPKTKVSVPPTSGTNTWTRKNEEFAHGI